MFANETNETWKHRDIKSIDSRNTVVGRVFGVFGGTKGYFG